MGTAATARGRQKQREAGRRGGLTTLSRYGREHFARMAAASVGATRPVKERTVVQRWIGLRLDQDEALRAVAASCGLAQAYIVRDALDLWLQEWEEAKAEAAAHRPMGKWKAEKKK